jgi:hypothetical protein
MELRFRCRHTRMARRSHALTSPSGDLSEKGQESRRATFPPRFVASAYLRIALYRGRRPNNQTTTVATPQSGVGPIFHLGEFA